MLFNEKPFMDKLYVGYLGLLDLCFDSMEERK